MNLKKCILLLALVITSTFAFGQNIIDEEVKTLTQKVNIKLTESSNNLRLSEEQIIKVKKLYRGFVTEKNKKSKSIKDKKELWKAMYPKLKETNNAIKSLLSKEQLAAYNSYKAK